MVQPAIADIVGPTVAAEDPEGILGEEFLVLVDLVEKRVAVHEGQDVTNGVAVFFGFFSVAAVFEPALEGFGQIFGQLAFQSLDDQVDQLGLTLGIGHLYAVSELGGVLEQGVAPGRAVPFGVDRVGSGRSGSAPDGGAARGVGDDHALAEELGQHLDVGGFAAARAGAGEFHQRLLELAALDGVATGQVVLEGYGGRELVVGHFAGSLGLQGLHDQSRGLGRADVGAVAAAHAVQGVDLDAELHALEFLADGVKSLEGLGSVGHLLLGQQHGQDGGVRADEGALVALDAVACDPLGHVDGHAALLELGGGHGEQTVRLEGGHGQIVALLGQDGTHDVLDEIGLVLVVLAVADGVGPGGRDLDLDQVRGGLIHGGDVHVDDLVALLAVGLLDGLLQQRDGLLEGHNVGQLEEGGLHDHVDAIAKAHFRRDLDRVDVVELEVLLGDGAAHGGGQFLLHVLGGPVGVQDEGAAVLDAVEHVVGVHVAGLVAGDVVGGVDQIGGLDGLLAETQVGHGDAAGLLGIVGEVALGVHVGVVADDLDGFLVGADGAVGAQAPELALHGAGRGGVGEGRHVEGGVGHIVVDADIEMMLGLGDQHIVINGLDHGRGELLGAQTVTAGDDLGHFAAFHVGGADVLVERITLGAGFLGAVEHGDDGSRGGQNLQEVLGQERTVEANLDQADLLALGKKVTHHFLDGFTGRTHGHDDALGLRVADIVEGLVGTAGDGGDLLHLLDHDGGELVVVDVGSFTALVVDVGVLGGTANGRIGRAHGAGAEFGDGLVIDDLLDVFVVDDFDLLNFMGRAEAVEEVQEGDARFKGGQMGDQGQVHAFLHGTGSQHGETGLATGHDVLVVAEDGQGMGCHGARADMEDARKQFAGNLVHVGDHEQEALGTGKGGGQRAAGQGAVDSAGRTGFGLHLTDQNLLIENIQPALSRPLVRDLTHGRRGGDRVNGGRVAHRIRDMGDGGVPIHGFHIFSHVSSPKARLVFRGVRIHSVRHCL
ncbi:hypothetical protein DSECCO2_492900 [anaerobic digester metagenome]